MASESTPKNEFRDPISGSEIFDVPRQHSECKILIYSHIETPPLNGQVDCSKDVIQCDTSKSIKGGGAATFVLVPRRNYLDYIFPNDYVHIYLNPGDGRGFVRVFFGFVDRIERSIATEASGASITRFLVVCSDFTKAFDKTTIYFNPHLADRGDFVSQNFTGSSNLTGTAIRTKGIRVWGTPADVVMAITQRLMGFGAQFAVPRKHPRDQVVVDKSREKRLKNLVVGLQNDLIKLSDPDALKKLQEKTREEQALLVNRKRNEALDMLRVVLKNKEYAQTTPDELAQMIAYDPEGFEYDPDALKRALSEGRKIYDATGNLSLLDLIDFSFVEYNAIDGSILSTQIWQTQGSIWSIMNTWANDLVNELFCDLRPVGENDKFDHVTGGYSRKPDEASGNIDKSIYHGIKMVPAIVMREYPFSTVESVQAGDALITSVFENYDPTFPLIQLIDPLETWKQGPIAMTGFGSRGGIFSQDPGKSGRKVIQIQSLNPWKIEEKATKHLDVVAISVQDIISEKIGRSDQDTVNLIEVYADLGIGTHGKYITQDFQPIANPISIFRDGLRVRTYVSRFARWPSNTAKEAGLDSPQSRYQTTRWALLLDHWYQHNKEYLNGTFSLRAFPEIRVGYRLDIKERAESYYVEAVNNTWTMTEAGAMLQTSVTVSRGQRNDPYPVYVLPALKILGGIDARNDKSRLANYFNTKNPKAVKAASIKFGEKDLDLADIDYNNAADIPILNEDTWGNHSHSYLVADATPTIDKINEKQIKQTLTEIREKRFAATEDIEQPGPSDPAGGVGRLI